MKGVNSYEGYKFEGGSVTKVSDPLTIERALEIAINGKPFTVVMQTPGDEEDLARGLLYAEDVIKVSTSITFETHADNDGLIESINISVDPAELGNGYMSARSLLSVSSCGICGKQSLEDLNIAQGDPVEMQANDQFPLSKLIEMQTVMVKNQLIFSETGGCHGVAAFDKEGTLLSLKEDIGRHNAMDKVVGELIRTQQLKSAKIIHFSGRLSYELVSKAFRAKIPLIMAVSAPSSLAIDFAKEYGITLLAFGRNNKATCYANCNRISS